MARLPRGKQANRIYDYRHAGTTALLEGGSVRLAKADGEDCPLAEVDPLYEGVFPPILNFGALRRSNLAEFVRAEATKTDEACAYSLPSHPHPLRSATVRRPRRSGASCVAASWSRI